MYSWSIHTGLVLPGILFPELFTEGKSRRNVYWHTPVMITEMAHLDGNKITEKLW